MPKVVLEWNSCDTCSHSFYNDKEWICCGILGEAIDYYLDYQGKLYPNCPLVKGTDEDSEVDPLQCRSCGKTYKDYHLEVGDIIECCGRKYIVDVNDDGVFLSLRSD